jgi:hypothetical protein
MSLQVSIDASKASTILAKLSSESARTQAAAAAGGAVRRQISDYLAILDDQRPNRLGGKRTHFYANAARSVSYKADPTGATVSINSTGIAQRLHGGTIKPVNAKFLTIPAISEAHGRRAGEFDFLQVVFGKSGRPVALAERPNQEIRIERKRGKDLSASYRTKAGPERGGKIYFWLVESVTQQPDPSVLPSEDSIAQAARLALLQHLATVRSIR